jgi:hypothetical protein
MALAEDFAELPEPLAEASAELFAEDPLSPPLEPADASAELEAEDPELPPNASNSSKSSKRGIDMASASALAYGEALESAEPPL